MRLEIADLPVDESSGGCPPLHSALHEVEDDVGAAEGLEDGDSADAAGAQVGADHVHLPVLLEELHEEDEEHRLHDAAHLLKSDKKETRFELMRITCTITKKKEQGGFIYAKRIERPPIALCK